MTTTYDASPYKRKGEVFGVHSSKSSLHLFFRIVGSLGGLDFIIIEGDYRYYHRFGFRTSTEFCIHASRGNLPPSVESLMARIV
ncbi:hypothetical protein [Bacillus sp. ISL-34]|uniref:hypothetical protein n=1 Tax=Bacillus sp. ISL-34 TaxID=2819121 RepID=UPI0025709491|nr:hypothetical protein [Bacillus sp. ISL-34]